jgi:hypothetical protein
MFDHPNTRVADSPEAMVSVATEEPQVILAEGHNLAVNIQRAEQGAAIHIIRYDYCEEDDRVPVLDSLDLDIRLAGQFNYVTCIEPSGRASATLSRDGDTHSLSLKNVPLYNIVLLSHDAPGKAETGS